MNQSSNILEASMGYDFITQQPNSIHLVLAETGDSHEQKLFKLYGNNIIFLKDIIQDLFKIEKANQILIRSDGTHLEAKQLIIDVLTAVMIILIAENPDPLTRMRSSIYITQNFTEKMIATEIVG